MGCAEAVEHFANIIGQLALELGDFESMFSRSPSSTMTIEGVEISLRPELLARIKSGRKAGKAGMIKLAISKSIRVDKEAGEHIASLLYSHAQSSKAVVDNIDRTAFKVIDVFAETIYSAPLSYKNRLKNVSAACQEIARQWEHV